MTTTGFQRARSTEAKQQREDAILAAARALATDRGIRQITLTDIAAAVGMHKSALLRYFENREQIFLRLSAEDWQDWGPAVRTALAGLETGGTVSGGTVSSAAIARTIASSLASRPVFCDLLAQAPLNLERSVSVEAVRAYKLVTHHELEGIIGAIRSLLPALTETDAVDVIAAATSLSGAFFEIATPGPEIEALYRSDPRLAHAVVDVEPRVARMLAAMIDGLLLARRDDRVNES